MRNMIAGIDDGIDGLTAAAGRFAAWCSLYVVIAEFAVVATRYLFGLGSIRLQESVLYADAALVMLAAASVLQVDGHVRVDIFYTHASPRTRAASSRSCTSARHAGCAVVRAGSCDLAAASALWIVMDRASAFAGWRKEK